MQKIMFGAMLALGLAGCGGGGGSAGETNQPYTISLRADKTQLPVNLGNAGPGIGANAAYTTTMYVEARQGNMPIPGGDGIFQCAVTAGLDSAVLYYLDGTDKKDDQGNITASRSIVLGSNSGSATFHLHAIDKAGVASVTCTVTDPRDKRQVSAVTSVNVGGAAQGIPASTLAVTQTPGYLGSRDNLSNLRNNVALEVKVVDDRNQPVTGTSPNVQVRILPSSAYDGARLISGSKAGSSLQVNSLNGIAQLSLSSGPDSGAIVLETTVDRRDNDVSNGIQDPIRAYTVVGVYHEIAKTPLALPDGLSITGVKDQPLVYGFAATGGIPPYRWSTLGGVPDGMRLSSDGVLSGTPTVVGTFNMLVRVQDAQGAVVDKTVTVTIAAKAPLAFTAPTISGVRGVALAYALSATGGTAPYTWVSLGGTPEGLALSSDGILSGTPTADGTFNMIVRVTDADNTVITRNMTITVAKPAATTP